MWTRNWIRIRHWSWKRRTTEGTDIILAITAVPSATSAREGSATQVTRILSSLISIAVAIEIQQMSLLAMGHWIRVRLVLVGAVIADIPLTERAVVSKGAAREILLAQVALEHAHGVSRAMVRVI